jgi:tRNA1(Val) A37 N6-methylase TrmN6
VEIVRSAAEAAAHNLKHQIERGLAQVRKSSAEAIFKDKCNWDRFDRFVINPPFFAHGSGRPNHRDVDQMARHDARLTLKSWARGARRLLKTGGELYCIFPTERLSELLSELTKQDVEPKEIWWFKNDKRKRRVFLRAVRGAKPGLLIHFDCV